MSGAINQNSTPITILGILSPDISVQYTLQSLTTFNIIPCSLCSKNMLFWTLPSQHSIESMLQYVGVCTWEWAKRKSDDQMIELLFRSDRAVYREVLWSPVLPLSLTFSLVTLDPRSWSGVLQSYQLLVSTSRGFYFHHGSLFLVSITCAGKRSTLITLWKCYNSAVRDPHTRHGFVNSLEALEN